ncbi:trypsin-like peptidase domain-containing protein [Caldibacillus lycopersici]|uniref:Trypsin-like peptidase domain-containing protein n=1 Tax=Perspicuibacillus lycopersici TaxID=1325689 RepID=A0AAE3IW30_9BACI|nr:trypsin-like peptidase domain-containing protein [Perspicuibacillus lycopersici]MCU9614673.1 trypsin-like peptidase domain-containing protein [Perspicuibacillus lycopersici]
MEDKHSKDLSNELEKDNQGAVNPLLDDEKINDTPEIGNNSNDTEGPEQTENNTINFAEIADSVNKEQNRDEQTKQSNKNRKTAKGFVKGIAANVSVSVISSLLTVSLVSYYGIPFAGGEDVSHAKELEQGNTATPANTAVYTSSNFNGTSEATIADIAEELAPTIVGVVNMQKMQNQFNLQSQNVQSGSGSGVIFKKDDKYAYILTNNHVIENANEVEISLYSGETTKAEIVGADALTDLAVLKIDQKYADKVASFGDSSKLRPGDEVIAIGNPLGLDFSRTVTQGIISALDRSISVSTSAGEWELSVIQTDAAINPGNSGGALINSNGEVIGINSLKISEEGVEGLGFAIPSNDAIPIAEELMANGEVKRAYIGVQLYNMSDIVQFYRQSMFGSLTEGIVIAGVEDGSPAAKAGLEVNDVIVAVDGQKISNATEFKQYLYKNIKPGDSLKVEFYRNGKKQTATIKTAAN